MMNAWITAFIASVANFIWGFLDGTIFFGVTFTAPFLDNSIGSLYLCSSCLYGL